MTNSCPDCGAVWKDDETCETHFHQMLYWEWEVPENGVVHHLMVISYHLQHPHLYSPEALKEVIGMLGEFVTTDITPEQMRQRIRPLVASDKRTGKIKGTADAHGSYPHPVPWTMTATDVVANGRDAYIDSVWTWARSVYESLKTSGNVPV